MHRVSWVQGGRLSYSEQCTIFQWMMCCTLEGYALDEQYTGTQQLYVSAACVRGVVGKKVLWCACVRGVVEKKSVVVGRCTVVWLKKKCCSGLVCCGVVEKKVLWCACVRGVVEKKYYSGLVVLWCG